MTIINRRPGLAIYVRLCFASAFLLEHAVQPTRRLRLYTGGSVAEWLACWTQAQKGPGSNRSRDAVG